MDTTGTTTIVAVDDRTSVKNGSAPPKNLSNRGELKAASACLPTSSKVEHQGIYQLPKKMKLELFRLLVFIVITLAMLFMFDNMVYC